MSDLDPVTAALRTLTDHFTPAAAGACDSFLDVPDLNLTRCCQYLYGHTGMHGNDTDGHHRWVDGAAGAVRYLDAGPAPATDQALLALLGDLVQQTADLSSGASCQITANGNCAPHNWYSNGDCPTFRARRHLQQHPAATPCGATRPDDPGALYPCTRAAGHTNRHHDQDGDQW